MNVRGPGPRRKNSGRGRGRERGRRRASSGGRGTGRTAANNDKEYLHCEHCSMARHTYDNCFKLHGYPDWYKNLKEQ